MEIHSPSRPPTDTLRTMRKILIGIGIVALCTLGIAAPAHAAPLTISYTLNASSPLGAGPFDNCSSPSPGPYFYKVSPFWVSAAGNYTLNLSAGAFIAVYTQPFTPSAPTANCVMASPASTVALPANQTYWLYLSTNGVSAQGTFTLAVDGPGVVTEGSVPSSTATELSVTPNPTTLGTALALTATVTGASPSGSVEFFDGATSIGNSVLSGGVAMLAYIPPAVGSHSLSAAYSGDGGNFTSVSAAIIVDVSKALTTTSLNAAPASVTIGSPTVLTATVAGATPTGSVEFFDGAASIGTAALSAGVATLSYTAPAAGSYSLTAAYSGDGDNVASTSAATTVEVDRAASTTSVSATPSSVTVGDPVTMVATVVGHAPTGAVEFFDGATSIGSATLAGGVATLSYSAFTVGAHSITASYSGDGDNLASASAAAILTATKATTLITLSTTPANATVGSPVTMTAAVTGATPTGSVEFFDGGNSLGTAPLIDGFAAFSITPTAAGTLSLTAVYSGDTGNDTSATSSATTVTVAAAPPKPSIAATGTDSIPLAVGGVALLGAGAALWLARRRRDGLVEHN